MIKEYLTLFSHQFFGELFLRKDISCKAIVFMMPEVSGYLVHRLYVAKMLNLGLRFSGIES